MAQAISLHTAIVQVPEKFPDVKFSSLAPYAETTLSPHVLVTSECKADDTGLVCALRDAHSAGRTQYTIQVDQLVNALQHRFPNLTRTSSQMQETIVGTYHVCINVKAVYCITFPTFVFVPAAKTLEAGTELCKVITPAEHFRTIPSFAGSDDVFNWIILVLLPGETCTFQNTPSVICVETRLTEDLKPMLLSKPAS